MNAGIDFLEFKASEIAAAVAVCVSEEIKDIDKAMSCLIHVDEVKILVAPTTEKKRKIPRFCFCLLLIHTHIHFGFD